MVKPLIYHQYMHNLYTIFSKILKICKQFGDNLINEKGNIPRPGVVPKFSDIVFRISKQPKITRNIQA